MGKLEGNFPLQYMNKCKHCSKQQCKMPILASHSSGHKPISLSFPSKQMGTFKSGSPGSLYVAVLGSFYFFLVLL